jgi:hypothetical protein
MLGLIRESNLPKNVRGKARGKHHTADNSSSTALKRKIQNRVATSANGRRNTLFGNKLGITGTRSVHISEQQNVQMKAKPTAVQLAEASNGIAADFRNVSKLLGVMAADEIQVNEFINVIAANPTNAQFAAARVNPPRLNDILGAAANNRITVDELIQFGFNDPLSVDLTQFQKDAIIAGDLKTVGAGTAGVITALHITTARAAYINATFTLTDAQIIAANPTDQQNTAAGTHFNNDALFTIGSATHTALTGGGTLTTVAGTQLTLAEFGDLDDLTPTQLAAFNAGDLTTIGAGAAGLILAAEIADARTNFGIVRANPTDAQNIAAGVSDLTTIGAAAAGQITLAELTTLGLSKTARLTAAQKTAVIDDSTTAGGGGNTDGNLTTLGAAAAGVILAEELIQHRLAQPTAAQLAAITATNLTTVGAVNAGFITAAELVAANTNANNIKAVVDGPRINQKPKGGNQGTYLYYKSIFPSMSLNSVTRQ